MAKFCAVCFTSLSPLQLVSQYFCSPCYEGFSRSSLDSNAGSSIYRYQGAIRSLILRAKVHGDLYALSALRSLFLESADLRAACSSVEQIVPIPSSLWGRLRGRIDIAWFLAEDAAKKFGCSFCTAPRHLHWRLRKRAMTQRDHGYFLQFPSQDATIPTLLIDDIVTTGYTLMHIASQLTTASCRFFTLAEAYNLGHKGEIIHGTSTREI